MISKNVATEGAADVAQRYVPGQGSPDVLVNNKRTLRQTDLYKPGDNSYIYKASETVFVNGLGIARFGDVNTFNNYTIAAGCSVDVKAG